MALIAVITDPEKVAAEEEVQIECAAPDDELLLVDWLNAVVYEIATRKMIFGRFSVRIEDGQLHGTAWGEPLDVRKHRPAVEVKGATHTQLRVTREPSGTWVAECVVDV